jgi:hypothetical protein
MADTKISALTAVATPASTDEFAVNQGGTSKKETRAQIHALQSGEHLVLPQVDEAATPTLAFGDGNSGLYEQADNVLSFAINGVRSIVHSSTLFRFWDGDKTSLNNSGVSATVPAFRLESDTNTGIGRAGADQLSLIAGGLEVIRCDGTVGTKGQVLLPQEDLAATPTLAFGDGNTGFYEPADNQIGISLSGTKYWDITSTQIGGGNNFARLTRIEATATVPSIYVRGNDADTGLGRAGVDQLSLIAGGVEGLRITEASSICTFDFDAGDNGAEQVGALTSLKSVSASVPGAAAATITATDLIPAGSFVVGITGRVETTFGGSVVSMDIGDGSDADRWGSAISTAGDTTWDLSDATASAGGWFTTATSVVFTGDVAFEASGTLDVIVHYFDLTAATA